MYRHLLDNPPTHPNGQRRRGGSHWDDYWRGYDGQRSMGDPGSICRAAWRAGRDARRSIERERSKKLNAAQDRTESETTG
jgi:hypothetical protein